MREDTAAISGIPSKLDRLRSLLGSLGPRVVACSGGVDSLLLSCVAHRADPQQTLIVHGGSAAVPSDALSRITALAEIEKWNFTCVESGEFTSEAYLSNPHNRCYFCKSNLYSTLSGFSFVAGHFVNRSENSAGANTGSNSCAILSGTNTDDLGEYRPGLEAAKEFGVRHPFVECGIAKSDIRLICRELELTFSELPASPCLSSRLYTGTRITPRRLSLVDQLEDAIRKTLHVPVVRARLKDREILIEIPDDSRALLTDQVLASLQQEFLNRHRDIIDSIDLDPSPYKPGRSFQIVS